jgi:hypothetical protein
MPPRRPEESAKGERSSHFGEESRSDLRGGGKTIYVSALGCVERLETFFRIYAIVYKPHREFF